MVQQGGQGIESGKALNKHRKRTNERENMKGYNLVWLQWKFDYYCLSNCVTYWRVFCKVSLPAPWSCLTLQL